MLNIQAFEVNLFGENTYIIWDSYSNEAAIIDPGMATSKEETFISNYISTNELVVKAILLTHLHIDHTFGIDFTKATYNAPIYANIDDEFLGQRRLGQAKMFHLPMQLSPIAIDKYINEGETIKLGNYSISALKAPGHTPGSLLYYISEEKALFTGDVIFPGSIGRTDLPGGSYPQLISSIHTKILSLPTDTIIYPGHGPSTTIAEELRNNPYI